MDYDEALRYIQSFTDYEKQTGYSYSEKTFDLRRPRALLSLMDDPHMRFPSVLVAGTKGKGSTSAMISSILRASGRRVGFYSQPHLHTFRERITIDGELITPLQLAEAVEAVVPAVEGLRGSRPDLGIPTSYEVATAAAMHFFTVQAPDLVVLEVGLGGRLDATNVVEPLVSVITPISLDHVQLLGDTIGEIAGEKAGIIKEHGLVVSSDQAAEAMEVIERTAMERKARLVRAIPPVADSTGGSERPPGGGADVERARPIRDRSEATLRGPSGVAYRVRLPLLGVHQLSNAATAIATVEMLAERGVRATSEAVEEGLAQVRWPGRLEIVSRAPLVVVDGAHNGDSAQRLAAALRENFEYRRLILVLAASADKDVGGIVGGLAPDGPAVIATRSRHARAADPETLAAEARRRGLRVEIAPDISAAMERAASLAEPSDLICVTGSLFIVADARTYYGLGIGAE
jgi:dihydrofolate synthase / folylpolyglutamate synthase